MSSGFIEQCDPIARARFVDAVAALDANERERNEAFGKFQPTEGLDEKLSDDTRSSYFNKRGGGRFSRDARSSISRRTVRERANSADVFRRPRSTSLLCEHFHGPVIVVFRVRPRGIVSD